MRLRHLITHSKSRTGKDQTERGQEINYQLQINLETQIVLMNMKLAHAGLFKAVRKKSVTINQALNLIINSKQKILIQMIFKLMKILIIIVTNPKWLITLKDKFLTKTT